MLDNEVALAIAEAIVDHLKSNRRWRRLPDLDKSMATDTIFIQLDYRTLAIRQMPDILIIYYYIHGDRVRTAICEISDPVEFDRIYHQTIFWMGS